MVPRRSTLRTAKASSGALTAAATIADLPVHGVGLVARSRVRLEDAARACPTATRMAEGKDGMFGASSSGTQCHLAASNVLNGARVEVQATTALCPATTTSVHWMLAEAARVAEGLASDDAMSDSAA